jgi:phosphoenolpyruvate synthase/pyruvate phosphate dikinase
MEEIQKLNEIKVLLKSGQITYDEAKVMAEPYIDKANQKIALISKKFKRNPVLISFSSFMR